LAAEEAANSAYDEPPARQLTRMWIRLAMLLWPGAVLLAAFVWFDESGRATGISRGLLIGGLAFVFYLTASTFVARRRRTDQ
jgi:hypothetical protein